MAPLQRLLTSLVAALCVALFARAAFAEVALCVEVRAQDSELAGLRKLVQSEIDRHPSHRAVEADCSSHLRVEVFEAAGVRYLTAQIDLEVPARFAISGDADLASRLGEALTLVLHNDPTYLKDDLTHYNDLQRLGHSVLSRGHSMFRFEVFETVANAGLGAAFASGGALGMTRGSGHWLVLGRVYGGGAFAPDAGTTRVLQGMAGIDAGLAYELFEKRSWTPYLSLCLGLQFLRFAGRETAASTAVSHAQRVGAAPSLRIGARFFRWNNFDADLFAQSYVPLFITRDDDGTLFSDSGVYTPTVQLGLGVGF